MNPVHTIPVKEYYLWRKPSGTSYPWHRQFLNLDFLKYEKKRLQESSDWYNKFIKTKNNGDLANVSFYTVPLEISSSWKAAIAEFGNFNYVGLSALFNSPQTLTIGLIPHAIKQPQEYKLVDVIQSKRINIINKKLGQTKPAVLIERWDTLKSDSVYVDIPYEKNIISDILNESLTGDDQLSLSFQAPIISAPYVNGSIGGISLSSISGRSEFAKELLKTIQLMVPPEYRTLMPPKSAYKGHDFIYSDGVRFHLAERPYFDNNVLSTIYAKGYELLNKEIVQRNRFAGEFSIFSTLNPDEGNVSQIMRELLKNFSTTDITIPRAIDDLPEEYVDLTRLKHKIDEDLWLQVVHSRQFMPGVDSDTDDELTRIIPLVKSDLDTHLSDVIRDATIRDAEVRLMLCQIKYSLKRIAQSFARANEKEELCQDYFKKARNLLVDNFYGFLKHPQVNFIKQKMSEKRENKRHSIVQTVLINTPHFSAQDVFENVKSIGLFEDIYDLQKFLDWLHQHGYVIESSDKKYTWVGR